MSTHPDTMSENANIETGSNANPKAQGEPSGESVLGATPCPSITLNFQGDTSKPHDIRESDYGKLKAAGLLWEFYPDAPDVFPTNAACPATEQGEVGSD